MATTLAQKLKDAGYAGEDLAGLQPLVSNQTFRADAETQIAAAEAAAAAAATAAALTGAYDIEVGAFATAVRGLNGVAKLFPEVASDIADAQAALALAMGKVKFNPHPTGTVPPNAVTNPKPSV